MLATPPFWASSNIALMRANSKPPLEVVVADLENQRKVPRRAIKRTTEFCEFCASGKRPAFIGVGSERDKTEAKRG